MPPKLFGSIVAVLATAAVLLLIEPWGGSDRTVASPGGPVASSGPLTVQTQAGRDKVADEEGYYPRAPSTAEGMTPEWREFAGQVDRICGVTYNQLMLGLDYTKQLGKRRGWSEERIEEASMRLSANQGLEIVYYSEKLGKPPERADLFYSWRDGGPSLRDSPACRRGRRQWPLGEVSPPLRPQRGAEGARRCDRAALRPPDLHVELTSLRRAEQELALDLARHA